MSSSERITRLAALEAAFAEMGGRGVEIADEIDALRAEIASEHPDDTSEEPCTDHGFDVCPDCGNGGIKIESTGGYVHCARFLTCWSDTDYAS